MGDQSDAARSWLDSGAGNQPPFGDGRSTIPFVSIFASHQRSVRSGTQPTLADIAVVDTAAPPLRLASRLMIFSTLRSNGEQTSSKIDASRRMG